MCPYNPNSSFDSCPADNCLDCDLNPYGNKRYTTTVTTNAGTVLTPNQEAKADSGKPEIRLVPPQIIRDIAEVRMYGNEKYHDPDNWTTVESYRYVDALLRHTLKFMEDPHSIDEESGLPHYKHMACNLAFLCEMLKEEK